MLLGVVNLGLARHRCTCEIRRDVPKRMGVSDSARKPVLDMLHICCKIAPGKRVLQIPRLRMLTQSRDLNRLVRILDNLPI